MPSDALIGLQYGLAEVTALREHPPSGKKGIRLSSSLKRALIAHRRACTVLLCSHFERYLYRLDELAMDYLNTCALPASSIPLKIRLLQSRRAVDMLAAKPWDKRDEALKRFFDEHSNYWTESGVVQGLQPGPGLESMKAPRVREVIRYFYLFEVDDIFSQITQTQVSRNRLTRGIEGLVDSRNGIAHGDSTVQPEGPEITEYAYAVRTFATRADRKLSKRLAALSNLSSPW